MEEKQQTIMQKKTKQSGQWEGIEHKNILIKIGSFTQTYKLRYVGPSFVPPAYPTLVRNTPNVAP